MALGRLFSALPVRQGDAADQIEIYVFALEDVTHQALDTVVAQAIRGSHPKFSRKFAPTCAELAEAIFDETARVQRQIELAEEKLKIADHRPVAARPMLIEERISAARQKMADEERKLLLKVDSHAASISPGRKMKPGSIYSGILCGWYGPVGSARVREPEPVSAPEFFETDAGQEILRNDMFEPESAPVEPEQPVDDVPDMPPMAPVEAYEDVEF
jgi:hypothetical protein